MKAKVKSTGEFIDVEQYECDHALGWNYMDWGNETLYWEDEIEILEKLREGGEKMNNEKKEEYRYQFAGMAMQAIIRASWTGTGNGIGNELAELAKNTNSTLTHLSLATRSFTPIR